MNRREILEQVAKGKLSVEEAEKLLSSNKIEIVEDHTNYDIFREKRTGIPEVIYSESKTPETVIQITERVLEKKPVILLSRLKPDHVKALRKLDEKYSLEFGRNNSFCRIMRKSHTLLTNKGKIGIITAGTSDLVVAEEAKAIAEIMGCEVKIVADVGVAGIHRLFEPLQELIESEVDVLIVAAGMEGALPTVVAGLVDLPVIGLPISTGYGYGGKGQTALMSMLQTCALGLAVVNIDAGVSAGAIAAKIAIQKRKCNCNN
ncbi:MAG: nickel pincer cofactor biosynthesis protein LarB [Candidatus Heimdallarchaeaceae archaeon]